jgi:hypothetical protein
MEYIFTKYPDTSLIGKLLIDMVMRFGHAINLARSKVHLDFYSRIDQYYWMVVTCHFGSSSSYGEVCLPITTDEDVVMDAKMAPMTMTMQSTPTMSSPLRSEMYIDPSMSPAIQSIMARSASASLSPSPSPSPLMRPMMEPSRSGTPSGTSTPNDSDDEDEDGITEFHLPGDDI